MNGWAFAVIWFNGFSAGALFIVVMLNFAKRRGYNA